MKRDDLMPIYNKLVRDRIPIIISESGKKAICYYLSHKEYIEELEKKLNEECAEYQADKSMEELADMLEVIYALVEAKGYSINELEKIRFEKAEKRGQFKNKIFLEKVED